MSGKAGVVSLVAGCHDVGVRVHPQHGSGQVGQGLDDRVHQRQRVHVGPQALGVDADDERVVRGPRSSSHSAGTTCGCGSTVASRPHRARMLAAAPAVSVMTASAAVTSTPSCASCVSDAVVWVSQIVHGEHERLAVLAQCEDDLSQALGRQRVEPEVDVHDVELRSMLVHPGAGEHSWRPPRGVGRGSRRRVREPDDGGLRRRWRRVEVSYVDMTGRDRGHNDAQGFLHERGVEPAPAEPD